jgi:hypothetical protein
VWWFRYGNPDRPLECTFEQKAPGNQPGEGGARRGTTTKVLELSAGVFGKEVRTGCLGHSDPGWEDLEGEMSEIGWS